MARKNKVSSELCISYRYGRNFWLTYFQFAIGMAIIQKPSTKEESIIVGTVAN